MQRRSETDPVSVAPRPDAMRVHFVGIAGCGMKGLAGYFLQQGHRVTGSDLDLKPDVLSLRRRGARLYGSHAAAHLPDDADVVIASRAIPETNPELAKARRRGVLVETYSQGLARVLRGHAGTKIAVAGTHGKTTTSAWLALMLKLAGRDPSFVIGGDGDNFGGNLGVGAGPEFVVEACEFGGSFLDLRPDVAVILNIEDDHQECYGGARGVMDAFGRFARGVGPGGKLIVDRRLLPALREWGVTAQVVPVGPTPSPDVHENGYFGKGYWIDVSADGTERLLRDGEPVVDVTSALPGEYNRINLSFAAAVALEVGVEPGAIADAASAFRGVKRRFERRGTFGGVTVVDDYAHHPTEVRAVVGTARHVFEGQRLTVVFEPHQHRRLETYLAAFADELSAADRVIVCDVFAARERPEEWTHVHPEQLVDAVRSKGVDARFVPLSTVVDALQFDDGHAGSEVVMTLGAGRVGEVADGLVRRLR